MIFNSWKLDYYFFKSSLWLMLIFPLITLILLIFMFEMSWRFVWTFTWRVYFLVLLCSRLLLGRLFYRRVLRYFELIIFLNNITWFLRWFNWIKLQISPNILLILLIVHLDNFLFLFRWIFDDKFILSWLLFRSCLFNRHCFSLIFLF